MPDEIEDVRLSGLRITVAHASTGVLRYPTIMGLNQPMREFAKRFCGGGADGRRLGSVQRRGFRRATAGGKPPHWPATGPVALTQLTATRVEAGTAVLLTGMSGALASTLASLAIARGAEVVGLSRRPDKIDPALGGTVPDLRDHRSHPRRPAGGDRQHRFSRRTTRSCRSAHGWCPARWTPPVRDGSGSRTPCCTSTHWSEPRRSTRRSPAIPLPCGCGRTDLPVSYAGRRGHPRWSSGRGRPGWSPGR